MAPDESPVTSPSSIRAAGDSGLAVVPPTVKPAIMPLHPRFRAFVDVCAVIEAGQVTFVARDVLEAIGHDLGDYASDHSHDAPTSFVDHATARTWSRTTIGQILLAVDDLDPARAFLRWLDDQIETLEVIGLDAMERKTRFGVGHRPAAAAAEPEAAAPTIPEYYSVAAAARVLSRDPGIGVIGRDALFEQLNKLAWVDRRGDTWKPNRDLVVIGYLLTQSVQVPSRPDSYPQVLITPFGIEALHKRLGGTADLVLHKSDHLTLIEA